MALHLIEENIINMQVDALVNSTNWRFIGYSGVDKLIHQTCGEEMERECEKLVGKLMQGEALHTNAYNCHAKYIIHTIGPDWNEGIDGEAAILRSCYKSSLEKAQELGCSSIAFPLISAGVHEYPIRDVLKNAIVTIREFLALNDDMEVYLVLFGESARRIADHVYHDLDRELDRKLNQHRSEVMYSMAPPSFSMEEAGCNATEMECSVAYKEVSMDYDNAVCKDMKPAAAKAPRSAAPSVPASVTPAGIKPSFNAAPVSSTVESAGSAEKTQSRFKASFKKPIFSKKSIEKDLDDIVKTPGEDFISMLYRFMAEKGVKKSSQLYNKAGISKNAFSKLVNGTSKNPSLSTAVALAMALELSYAETEKLLQSAGLALSDSSKYDIIVKYFIQHEIYDIWELDVQLVRYGCKSILGLA